MRHTLPPKLFSLLIFSFFFLSSLTTGAAEEFDYENQGIELQEIQKNLPIDIIRLILFEYIRVPEVLVKWRPVCRRWNQEINERTKWEYAINPARYADDCQERISKGGLALTPKDFFMESRAGQLREKNLLTSDYLYDMLLEIQGFQLKRTENDQYPWRFEEAQEKYNQIVHYFQHFHPLRKTTNLFHNIYWGAIIAFEQEIGDYRLTRCFYEYMKDVKLFCLFYDWYIKNAISKEMMYFRFRAGFETPEPPFLFTEEEIYKIYPYLAPEDIKKKEVHPIRRFMEAKWKKISRALSQSQE